MLKDRTWLTENTEILTVLGWIPIKSIHKTKDVVVYDDETGKIKLGSIQEYNIRNYSGKIPTKKSKRFIQGFIKYFEDCDWSPIGCSPKPKTMNLEYSGKLYNVVTKANTLFIRNLFNGKNNQDYTLVLCQK